MLSSAAEGNVDVIEKSGEGGEGGDEVCACGPFQSIFGVGGFLAGGDTGAVKPGDGTFGSIVLHGQRDEGEQGC